MIGDVSAFRELLKNSQNSRSILFCGAGFSADCLNFNQVEIGTSAPLLHILNDKLGYEYSSLQMASEAFLAENPEVELLKLLKSNFTVESIPVSVSEILKYPWYRIYTTNYDDVISQSLLSNKKKYVRVNNTDQYDDIKKINGENTTWVVHLHGSLERWDLDNFSNSCVLSEESYLKISNEKKWSNILREDYAAAGLVVFIGFSNSDFYLKQNLFSVEANKNKVFFVNQETSIGDKELTLRQKSIGRPIFVDKLEVSEMIADSLKHNPEQLSTRSFNKFTLPNLPGEAASVDIQEGFLCFGKENLEFQYKDVVENSSSYRSKRSVTSDIISFLDQEGALALIVGGICSGKTTIINELKLSLAIQGKNVFYLNNIYPDVISELQKVVNLSHDLVIIVDDCFSARDYLLEILKITKENEVRVILASRSIARDAEVDIGNTVGEDVPFQVFDTEVLDSEEVIHLVGNIDRIGGWGSNEATTAKKQQNIERKNNSRLASTILDLFNSEHISNRFKVDLDKFLSKHPHSKRLIILCLYLRHIGERLQPDVIAELLCDDPIQLLGGADKLNIYTNTFVWFDRQNQVFEVIASINARSALKQFFTQNEIRDTVVTSIINMENARKQPRYKHIFSQLMRYTQLKGVVTDEIEQEKFFDRLSELYFCRSHILFWLQWSMAKRDSGDYVKAVQHLERAYSIAGNIDSYDTYQLDDQKVGIMLESYDGEGSSQNTLNVFREALSIMQKLLNRAEKTGHPYRTILHFEGFFQNFEASNYPELLPLFLVGLKSLKNRVIQSQSEIEKSRSNGHYLLLTMKDAVKCLEGLEVQLSSEH